MRWSSSSALLSHLALFIAVDAVLGLPSTAPHASSLSSAPQASTNRRGSGSSGCGTSPKIPAGDDADATVSSSGRLYHVYVPDSYDAGTPTPLILSYHGKGAEWSLNAEESRLHLAPFNTGQIVAYMQGMPNADGDTTWYGAPGAETHDDIDYTAEVLDALEEQYCIDVSREYAVGFSQGGGMVGRLACDPEASTRFAAFAPHVGAYYITQVDEEAECKPWTVDIPCNPGRSNVPIFAMHGGSDDTIDVEGDFRTGACLPAIEHWAEEWALRDGASAEAAMTLVEGTTNGKLMVYGDGKVRFMYAGDDVEHTWMSKERGTADVEGTQLIMDFLEEFALA